MVNGYSYVAAPTLTSVTPNSGPAAGGAPVTISGSGFQAGAVARFGDALCTNAVVTVPNTITCNTPAASPVAVNVTVTNPDGQSDILVDGYQYFRQPTMTTINASANPVRVGEPVSFAIEVSGDGPPSDGRVTVTASSGENCIDNTPQVGGTSASFSCQISFGSLGPRTISAFSSDSVTHLDSSFTALNLIVARLADLSVTISDGQNTVQPGEALSYLV
ncbi:MAG: IPT/TIG domain-containing protein [Xanthomonadales bacterium]|nr:IPT/TIG domain-containing protein [Xanthomonadales bacterium]